MSKILLILFISIYANAQYEKAYIDTHGGKAYTFGDKKNNFSEKKLTFLFSPKATKDSNLSKENSNNFKK